MLLCFFESVEILFQAIWKFELTFNSTLKHGGLLIMSPTLSLEHQNFQARLLGRKSPVQLVSIQPKHNLQYNLNIAIGLFRLFRYFSTGLHFEFLTYKVLEIWYRLTKQKQVVLSTVATADIYDYISSFKQVSWLVTCYSSLLLLRERD